MSERSPSNTSRPVSCCTTAMTATRSAPAARWVKKLSELRTPISATPFATSVAEEVSV